MIVNPFDGLSLAEVADLSGLLITDLFVGEPVLRCPPRSDDFILDANVVIIWKCNGVSRGRLAPAGQTTDLASVPALFRSVVPPHKRIKRAAVFHDDLYQNRPLMSDLVSEWGGPPTARITRGEADALLHAICILDGISEQEAGAIYTAVRFGGHGIWHAHDEVFGA